MTEIATPSKNLHGSRSKHRESPELSENFNPNTARNSPQKSATKKKNAVANKMKDRKFVVAKKKNNKEKCMNLAYENLRASQEEFFKADECHGLEEEMERKLMIEDCSVGNDGGVEECEVGNSVMKRRRERLMEEARKSLPESGLGRVMHLVKAFENLKTVPTGLDKKEDEVKESKVEKWALPGLNLLKESELALTSENLGLDSGAASGSSSSECSHGSGSRRSSIGSRRSRRNSIESTSTMGGRRLKKTQPKTTLQKPFKLRTDQRGKSKEREFEEKLYEKLKEEERQRIPVAQGLPWTTDEPECLIKPPVKESTMPLDLKLHTDLRAVDRAEFEQQVAEKMCLLEQYKRERERQRKLAEEEEIRRLRKDLVPKAQPMPCFDKPFIPRRAAKHPTVPREPQFHIHENKKIKCGLSTNDINSCC